MSKIGKSKNCLLGRWIRAFIYVAGASWPLRGVAAVDPCQGPLGADCNHNGIPDACDISQGTSQDCNVNGTPDECELQFYDCNHNHIPDSCDIAIGTSEDCDGDGRPDECDLWAHDCNHNGLMDSCELAAGTASDCDHDNYIDSCAVTIGAVLDCNGNGIPDSCDISSGVEPDCDCDGLIDACAIVLGFVPDCNRNGVPDGCDLAAGSSIDANGDRVPDECHISAIYVSASAAPGGDGETWDSAFQSLQDGLDAAAQLEMPHREIWVSQGTYRPSKRVNLDDPRSATFDLIEGVRLRGGFAGPGTGNPSARDWNAFPTILSGDIAGNDGPNFQNYDENSYHVVRVNDLRVFVLDGLIITGGNASLGPTDDYGGGLYQGGNGHPVQTTTITNCTFRQNEAGNNAAGDATAHAGRGGAGLAMGYTAAVYISGCKFQGNRTDGDAGGAIIYGTSADEDLPRGIAIVDCLFEGNTAGSSGGGLTLWPAYGPVDIRRCSLLHNSAVAQGDAYGGSGGGASIYYSGAGNVTIADSTFEGNTSKLSGGALASTVWKLLCTGANFENNAAANGGGVALGYSSGSVIFDSVQFRTNYSQFGGGGIFAEGPTTTVKNGTFSSNSSGGPGGAIYIWSRGLLLTDCDFEFNDAPEGGAVFGASANIDVRDCTFYANTATVGGGGAVSLQEQGKGKVATSIFNDNSAVNGGAIYWGDADNLVNSTMLVWNHGQSGGAISQTSGVSRIENCTIAGNTSDGLGAGIITGGDTTMRNTILWDNVEDPFGGAYTDELAQVEGIRFVKFSHCCVQGWTGAYGDDTNFGDDPKFVNPRVPDGYPHSGDVDYHLSPGSPCINAGANPDPNCGEPNMPPCPPTTDLDGHPRILCGTVDIGAYEFGIGDSNCDQTVNLDDFAKWESCTTGPLAYARGSEESIGNRQSPIEIASPLTKGGHRGFAPRELKFAARDGGQTPPYNYDAKAGGPRPDGRGSETASCEAFDFDADGGIDLIDFAALQNVFGK